MKQDTKSFREAQKDPRPTLIGEFIYFLRENKKWWLLPILVIFLLMSALVVIVNSGAGPFIYPLI